MVRGAADGSDCGASKCRGANSRAYRDDASHPENDHWRADQPSRQQRRHVDNVAQTSRSRNRSQDLAGKVRNFRLHLLHRRRVRGRPRPRRAPCCRRLTSCWLFSTPAERRNPLPPTPPPPSPPITHGFFLALHSAFFIFGEWKTLRVRSTGCNWFRRRAD